MDDKNISSISRIVEMEAKRFFSEAQLKPNPELVAQGWKPRFIGDARQVKEAVDLYTELGFEVLAEPVATETMGDDCSDCQVVIMLQFKTIYTRRKDDSKSV